MTDLKTILEIALTIESREVPEDESDEDSALWLQSVTAGLPVEDVATAVTLCDLGHALITRLEFGRQ